MSSQKISLCKKLQYAILYNKKFDWLIRKPDWKMDRIDGYIGVLMLTLFLLVSLLGEIVVVPVMLLFYSGAIVGYIRHIKSIPGDVESKLVSPMICIGLIFISISLIIMIFIAIGKLI